MIWGIQMRVDFSEWFRKPGLVARQYKYSQLGESRDFEIEVHFDIQPAYIVETFISFLISDLDLAQETNLLAKLEPMDGSAPAASFKPMGRPDGAGGMVMSLFGREDQRQCLAMFLKGKPMHFQVVMPNGELLIKVPLPNDDSFKAPFDAEYQRARTAYDAENPDGILGQFGRASDSGGFLDRIGRFFSGRH